MIKRNPDDQGRREDRDEDTQEEESTPRPRSETDFDSKDSTILAVAENPKTLKTEDTYLLAGSVKTMNPQTKQLRRVQVTGADRSSIDSKLAHELQLPRQGTSTMRLSTFGTTNQREITCTITSIDIWDQEGVQHTLRLFIHDTITSNVTRCDLEKRDINFIRRKHIHVCSPIKKGNIQPRILIGCDQLWNFVKFEAPHFTLPFGLLLIPTVFGYMISGQKLSQKTTSAEQNHVLVQTSNTSEHRSEKNFRPMQKSEGEEPPTETCFHLAQSSQVEITDVMNLEAFSNFTKAKRILAYALRFLKKLSRRLHPEIRQKLFENLPWLQHQPQEDHLTARDILDAQHILIRNHQLAHINAQYRKELTKNLNLKEDHTKILRAYGRLNRSDLNPTAKNPILIVPNTHLSRLIINEAHGPYH
ncbi:hypothetical protein OSTOST_01567, partial [Ostertagia ostertagi]